MSEINSEHAADMNYTIQIKEKKRKSRQYSMSKKFL